MLLLKVLNLDYWDLRIWRGFFSVTHFYFRMIFTCLLPYLYTLFRPISSFEKSDNFKFTGENVFSKLSIWIDHLNSLIRFLTKWHLLSSELVIIIGSLESFYCKFTAIMLRLLIFSTMNKNYSLFLWLIFLLGCLHG